MRRRMRRREEGQNFSAGVPNSIIHVLNTEASDTGEQGEVDRETSNT